MIDTLISFLACVIILTSCPRNTRQSLAIRTTALVLSLGLTLTTLSACHLSSPEPLADADKDTMPLTKTRPVVVFTPFIEPRREPFRTDLSSAFKELDLSIERNMTAYKGPLGDCMAAGRRAFAAGNLEEGRKNFLMAVKLLTILDDNERPRGNTRENDNVLTRRYLLTQAATYFMRDKKYAVSAELAQQAIDLGNKYTTPVGKAVYSPEYALLAESDMRLGKYDKALKEYDILAGMTNFREMQLQYMYNRMEIYKLMKRPDLVKVEEKEADEVWRKLHAPDQLLKVACQSGNLDEVKAWVAKGANPNGDGQSRYSGPYNVLQPLHNAVLGNYLDVAQFLLDKGADSNIQVGTSGTPLHLAVYAKSVPMAELLLKYNADVNARVPYFIVGAAPDTVAPEQQATPLHFAAQDGDLSMVKCLVEHKAKIDSLDAAHRTPLDWAEGEDVRAYLIDKGARSGRDIKP